MCGEAGPLAPSYLELEERLAAVEKNGIAWERACEMAVMERDGARKAAQTYHDNLVAAEARCHDLERQRTEYDCRFVGRYAEMSGSHCPFGNPCQRCRLEAAEARCAELEKAVAAWADVAMLPLDRDRDPARRQAEEALAEVAGQCYPAVSTRRLSDALRALLAATARETDSVGGICDEAYPDRDVPEFCERCHQLVAAHAPAPEPEGKEKT